MFQWKEPDIDEIKIANLPDKHKNVKLVTS